MADIFDEVNEELRQERLEEFWKENGKFILICAFLTVAMTAAVVFWRQWQMQVNTALTTGLVQASQAEEIAGLEEYSTKAGGKHGALAGLIAASKYAEEGDNEKAALLYARVASSTGVDKLYSEFASVQSLGRLLDGKDADFAGIETRLAPIANGAGAWNRLAREYLSMAQAAQGKYAEAAKTIETLVTSADIPADMRTRALMWHDLFKAKASLKTGMLDTGEDKAAEEKEGSAG